MAKINDCGKCGGVSVCERIGSEYDGYEYVVKCTDCGHNKVRTDQDTVIRAWNDKYPNQYPDNLTIRDHFAMAALQGLIITNSPMSSYDVWSKAAYEIADSMIKIRGEH